MDAPVLTGHDRAMEEFLGKLLRIGVSLSALVVAAGAVWYLIRHASEHPDYSRFHGTPPNLLRVSAVFSGIAAGHSQSLIQLGLLLLIATPVARVVFSLILFARERDWTYVAITIVVLAVLVAGLTGF